MGIRDITSKGINSYEQQKVQSIMSMAQEAVEDEPDAYIKNIHDKLSGSMNICPSAKLERHYDNSLVSSLFKKRRLDDTSGNRIGAFGNFKYLPVDT